MRLVHAYRVYYRDPAAPKRANEYEADPNFVVVAADVPTAVRRVIEANPKLGNADITGVRLVASQPQLLLPNGLTRSSGRVGMRPSEVRKRLRKANGAAR